MDFFKPISNTGDGKNTKLTGASINKDTEDRLKNIKEKRKDRRDKINNRIGKEDNSYFKESEKLRKNKDLSRREYQRQERRDISRLGLRENKNDEK